MADSRPPEPSLPNSYLTPRRSRLAAVSASLAAAVLASLIVLFLAGGRRVASPGPIADKHASVANQCAACHEAWRGIDALRCEACHDVRDRGTYAIAPHAASARPRVSPTAAQRDTNCDACHIEHRGTRASLTKVADRACINCHGVTWSSHPDLAAFKAAPAPGLRFSHSLHLPEERKTLGKGCEGCHERKPESARFEPVAFDAHCAACHVKGNALDQIRVKTDKPHRDAASLAQATALGRLIDSDARSAERIVVVDRMAEADRLLAEEPYAPSPTSRVAQRGELTREWTAKSIAPVVPAPSAQDAADRQAVEFVLTRLRRRLSQIDAPLPPVSSTMSFDASRSTIATVLAPCLACHEIDGAALRPVASAHPTLTPVFNHAPHVGAQRQACESCHETIDRSGSAIDVNLPHVSKCQTCHGKTPAAPTACSSCHRYHGRLSGPLSAWTPAGSF